MKIKHIDHIGIVVDDYDAVKQFFYDLGFTLDGESPVSGEWVERIIGLHDVKEDVAMLKAPDGQLNIELVKFHRPIDPEGIKVPASNTFGLRHLAFVVDDIDEVTAELSSKGYPLVGEIQAFQDAFKLCYVRGPENIIIELVEQIGADTRYRS